MQTTFTSNFSLIRLLDKSLVPSNCEVKIHLEIEPAGDDRKQEACLKAIKLWLENYLDGSIAYYPGTTVDTTLFEDIANNIILTPDEPNDYHLCILLHSKLNAIGQNLISISKTEFASDKGEGFSCSISGSTSEWLPSNKDWMGEDAIFDQPWWVRKDGSTIDLPYHQGDDKDLIRQAVLIDLVGMVIDDQPSQEQNAEIIKPAFKLKLIDNDNPI